jgi:hypothetical protein
MREINGILSKYRGEFQMHPMTNDLPGSGSEIPRMFLPSSVKSESLDKEPPGEISENSQSQNHNVPPLDYYNSHEFQAWSRLVNSIN